MTEPQSRSDGAIKSMSIKELMGSDEEYFRWIKGDGETGFVANIRDTREEYVMLHRATCGAIRNRLRAGYTYTETGREKVWSDCYDELEEWAREHVRPIGQAGEVEILRCDCLDQ